MDRRMYRGNVGSGRNMPPNRQHEHCNDMCGGSMHEDMCDKHSHEDMCDRHSCEDMCDRDKRGGNFDRFPLAMCYVPWQCFRNLYENEFEALANATLFKELDLKWYGRGCR